jgi:Zn-dependent protease
MHLDFTSAILNVALLWLLTTPHEFAHAWVATRLGDDTPRLQGRLTLNPLAHVDWLGTTILPALTSLFGGGLLGWGKPVYSNPSKLRWGLNGLALVAMAGPASNVVFAVILAVVARATAGFAPALAQFAAARAAAGWLQAAAGRAHSPGDLQRTGARRISPADRGRVLLEPGPLDVAVELRRD